LTTAVAGIDFVAAAQRDFEASAEWRGFLTRLRFADDRSARMKPQQYGVYARAREAGFTTRGDVMLRFAAALPGAPLTKASLEVLGFLAYDRICAIVEAANATAHGGTPAFLEDASLSDEAYKTAIAAAVALPAELEATMRRRAAANDRKPATSLFGALPLPPPTPLPSFASAVGGGAASGATGAAPTATAAASLAAFPQQQGARLPRLGATVAPLSLSTSAQGQRRRSVAAAAPSTGAALGNASRR